MPPQALSPNQIVWVEEPCLTLAQAFRSLRQPSRPKPSAKAVGSKIDFASYPTFMSAV